MVENVLSQLQVKLLERRQKIESTIDALAGSSRAFSYKYMKKQAQLQELNFILREIEKMRMGGGSLKEIQEVLNKTGGFILISPFSMQKGAEVLLDNISPEERLEIFQKYCPGCGDKNSQCYCSKDE